LKSASSIFPPGKTYKFPNGGREDLLTIRTSNPDVFFLSIKIEAAGDITWFFINYQFALEYDI
jgi:mannose-6-phosphate isomerase-like protein (cupin superfamily)